MRLARRYQGYGGTRFVEDDPEAGALAGAALHHGPSAQHCSQAAADLIHAGAAAAQAFRQDAADYVRLNVLPRRRSRLRRS